jgi:hypothetical protein
VVLTAVFFAVAPAARSDEYVFTVLPASQGEAYFLPERQLQIQLCFENLDDYPEYDFYLKYGRSAHAPLRHLYLTRVSSGEFVHLEGQGLHLTPVYLLAMPRGQQPSLPDKHCRHGRRGGEHWLKFAPDGGLQSTPLIGPDPASPLVVGVEGSRVVYRVTIENGQLEATRVSVELQGQDQLMRLVAVGVGVGVSLGFASLLLWRLIRSQVRSASIGTL